MNQTSHGKRDNISVGGNFFNRNHLEYLFTFYDMFFWCGEQNLNFVYFAIALLHRHSGIDATTNITKWCRSINRIYCEIVVNIIAIFTVIVMGCIQTKITCWSSDSEFDAQITFYAKFNDKTTMHYFATEIAGI